MNKNMSWNNLGEHGPATAAALATSHTIHTVNMRSNELGAHGPDTATVFTDHNQYVAALDIVIHQPDCILSIVMPTVLVDMIGSYEDVPIDFML